MSLRSLVLAAGLCASAALARTDLAGCTYTDLVIKPTQQAAYASRLYYVPDTGEVCAFLDCGGGRAPPKTTVPGCPQYKGTETYKPSYIDPKTLGNDVIAAGTSVVMATEPVTAVTTTAAASSGASATSASASATSTEKPSVTILTGTNTPSSSGSSSAQVTSPPSGSSAAASTSSSGVAKTTTPSSAAGAMHSAAAVLGPCVMAAIAAGLA